MKNIEKSKKSKKIFKDKQKLIKYLQDLPSEIQEFQLLHQQEKLAFSDMHKDKSILIESPFVATEKQLNKKLEKFTEWKLKMCSISLAAQFGICQIDNKTKKIGNIYGLYAQGYWPARNIETGYQFENDTWIKLAYNPQEQSLLFFNQKTKKSLQIQIPKKQQSFEYYPYIFLYKATVHLNEEPDYDPFDYDQMYQEHMKAAQEEQKRKEGQKECEQRKPE